jgi:hypothetical protein
MGRVFIREGKDHSEAKAMQTSRQRLKSCVYKPGARRLVNSYQKQGESHGRDFPLDSPKGALLVYTLILYLWSEDVELAVLSHPVSGVLSS